MIGFVDTNPWNIKVILANKTNDTKQTFNDGIVNQYGIGIVSTHTHSKHEGFTTHVESGQ